MVTSGRLERKGPFGDEGIQSSNRAELRAVIAALRYRPWSSEKIHTVVIATHSDYVVEGSTTWVKGWIQNGWKTSRKVDVMDRDLWEALLGEVEWFKDGGLAIEFWRIPREWNAIADTAAEAAAGKEDQENKWLDIIGIHK